MKLQGFDASKVEPNGTFEPIPANWYTVAFTAAEEKPTKAKTGAYLELKAEVLEGDYKGRLIFDRLNLENPNQQAVDIAQATLSAICRAVGVMMPKDSAELLNKPLMAKVVVKPADGAYSAGNEIKGYDACNSASSTVGGGDADQGGDAATTPPWKR